MKIKTMFTTTLSLLFVALISGSLSAQDCKFFYPTQVGTTLEYTYYNKKGKADSKQYQKIVDVRDENGATVVSIEATTEAGKKSQEELVQHFDVKCEDGKFFMNMNDFTSAFNYEQYQNQPNMKVSISSEGLFYPSDLTVGQTLADGFVQIDVAANDINMFATTITVSNRKVEALETLTTPAGTFKCVKISADVETKSFVTMNTKTVQWLSEDLGVVRSENLKSDGQLVSYQELTKIEK